jgi:hypothetical protein
MPFTDGPVATGQRAGEQAGTSYTDPLSVRLRRYLEGRVSDEENLARQSPRSTLAGRVAVIAGLSQPDAITN